MYTTQNDQKEQIVKLKDKLVKINKSFKWFHKQFSIPMDYKEFLREINWYEKIPDNCSINIQVFLNGYFEKYP